MSLPIPDPSLTRPLQQEGLRNNCASLHPTMPNPFDNPYQTLVFAPVAEERDRILSALYDNETCSAFRIAKRIAECCMEPMVLTNDAHDAIRLAEKRCRSRLCPRCRVFRRNELTAKLMEAVRRMDARRFVTLTLQSCDDPLRDQLKHLRESFSRLRRSNLWRARVTGGAYCVEVTFNREARQWHPHLHAIVDGKYVPKRDLVEAWRLASSGSYIVDIASVSSASSVVAYVTKYVAKSDDSSSIPTPQIAEWAVEVHGLRLVHTFGSLHGVQLLEKPESQPRLHHALVSPNVLADRAANGDRVARSILDQLTDLSRGKPGIDQSMLYTRITAWQTWYYAEMRTRPPPDPVKPAAEATLF